MNGRAKLQTLTADTRVCVLPTTCTEAYAEITPHYIFAFQDDVQLSNHRIKNYCCHFAKIHGGP